MSKTYKGDVTGNVVELNLLDANESTLPNLGTPTIVTKNTGPNVVEQVVGDIPANWKQNDTSLKGLVIGTSCTSIGNYAFQNCSSLTGSLVIPDSVTSIGSYAFNACLALTGPLIIGNSVTSIRSYAFQDTDTSSRVIPNSVTSIGDYAFAYNFVSTTDYVGCPASSFTGSNAFYGCQNLNTLYAKDAVSNGYTLGSQTFQGRSLTIANWDNYPNPIPN